MEKFVTPHWSRADWNEGSAQISWNIVELTLGYSARIVEHAPDPWAGSGAPLAVPMPGCSPCQDSADGRDRDKQGDEIACPGTLIARPGYLQIDGLRPGHRRPPKGTSAQKRGERGEGRARAEGTALSATEVTRPHAAEGSVASAG